MTLDGKNAERYCLAEAVAGVKGNDKRWQLDWNAHHLLLLTATPHVGKDYPYYALWRLLEPEMLATVDAFGSIRLISAKPISFAVQKRKWSTPMAVLSIPSASPTPWATI